MFIFEYFASSDLCSLPQPKRKINWNRLRGDWYRTIINRKGDKVCLAIKDIKSTNDGFSSKFYNTEHPHNLIPIDWVRNAFGVYSRRVDMMKYVNSVCTSGGESLILRNATKDSLPIEFREHVYYTDYKNYVVVLACGNGKKVVTGHTLVKIPTAEHMRLMHNALSRIGHGWGDLILQFTGCVKKSYREPDSEILSLINTYSLGD